MATATWKVSRNDREARLCLNPIQLLLRDFKKFAMEKENETITY